MDFALKFNPMCQSPLLLVMKEKRLPSDKSNYKFEERFSPRKMKSLKELAKLPTV